MGSRDTQIFDLIGAWYEATTDVGRWPAVLAQLCTVFTADKAQIVGFDLSNNSAWLSIGHGTDPTHLEKFLSLVPYDPRSDWAIANPGKPLSCRVHLPPEAMQASRIYREFFSLPEVDIEYSLGLSERIEEKIQMGYAFMRGRSGHAFTQADCDDLGRLAPHCRNAAFILHQFEAARAVSSAIQEVLDKVLTPMIVVDGACHVVHANAAAKNLADRGHVALRHNQLWLARSEDSRALRAAVADIADLVRAGATPPSQRLRLPRADGGALSIHIAPFAGDREHLVEMRPAALVTVLDPQGRYETTPQVLRRLYGLTHAEADLLGGLINGATAGEIAGRRGTASETVRDQLKAIYRKTGASDQASLVRLVAGNPILRACALDLRDAD